MERKVKIMGIYVGLLFFVSILLILITSLSNSKFDPSYDLIEEEKVTFSKTMEDSVSKLTETNQNLNEKVSELNGQIDKLKESLYQKSEVVVQYEKMYNDDFKNLQKALSLYLEDNDEEAKKIIENVKKENLNPENQTVYDNLMKKLN